MNYNISHPTNEIECEINLPSSKSISNRLLMISALCEDKFEIINLSESDDTISLKNILNNHTQEINVGATGTSFRFLTSYLATLAGKEFILTGNKRIQERPIKELVEVLNNLGADISYVRKKGFAPLRIVGKNLLGGEVTIDGSISSQFITSLLLISPNLMNGIKINILGKIVSRSYIEMTLKMMREFGVNSRWVRRNIEIKPQKYIARDYSIESDWSAASFWFEIAALSKKSKIILNGLKQNSIQGDSELINLFADLSIVSTFNDNVLTLEKIGHLNFPSKINLINTPDLYQPLKCVLISLGLNSRITGIDTLLEKETNRVAAVDRGFKRLYLNKSIDTYQDHRMAMSFAPLSLRYGEININNINVVSKSYPNFWKDLEKAGFKIES